MIPDYFLLSEWWHLKNTNRILNICTKTKLKGAIFISCTIPIKKWKTPPCRCSHSSPQVFQPVAILSSPGSYIRTAGSRLLKWCSSETHMPPRWNLPELFSSWSKRNQWVCKHISRGGMAIPQTGRLTLMTEQHASLRLHRASLFLSLLITEADTSTSCTPVAIYRVSVPLK